MLGLSAEEIYRVCNIGYGVLGGERKEGRGGVRIVSMALLCLLRSKQIFNLLVY